MNDNYKGFSLFNDIEDTFLRNRNRAVVLTNLASDHTKERKISNKGAALILGYFNALPAEDRKDVQEKFKANMESKGYVLAARG
jgi:hypothetical protein